MRRQAPESGLIVSLSCRDVPGARHIFRTKVQNRGCGIPKVEQLPKTVTLLTISLCPLARHLHLIPA